MAIITAKQASQILEVSEATIRNWVKHSYLTPVKNTKNKFTDRDVAALKKRIETGEIKRLRNRANKKISDDSFVPKEYLNNVAFIREIEKIRNIFISNSLDLETTLYVLTLKQLVLSEEVSYTEGLSTLDLKSFHGWKRNSIQRELCLWFDRLDVDVDENIRNYNNIYGSLTDISHDDTIGIVYQSLLMEGSKSKRGSYYTPGKIVDAIFKKYNAKDGKILDPCCATGQFLLGAVRSGCSAPELLYGYDIDGIAVQIARINMLLAFPEKEFEPQIFEANALTDLSNGTLYCEINTLKNSFNLIATNPPWGAAENEEDKINYSSMYPHITSGESFSLFLSKCMELAAPNGHISFILPESILNIKTHADIRKHIIDNTTISEIHYLGRKFKGVFTPVIRLDLEKKDAPQDWTVSINIENHGISRIPQTRFRNNRNYIFDIFLSENDYEIISLLYAKPYITLKGHAEWALGIVTGDNKKYISEVKGNGMEPVYKGSDVEKYSLKKSSSYIEFKPELFQQVAPEYKYRAKEKLIYKFISDKLVFAYDTNGCLTLNSANILIPKLDNYPIKLILAFLNSSLFQFVFSRKYNTRKILRGDLESLPFPILNYEDKNKIISLVEQIIDGNDVQSILDNKIMNIYGLSAGQINRVLSRSKGK